MGECRKIIAAVVMVVIVAGAVHADLMPAFDTEAGFEFGVCMSALDQTRRTTPAEPLLAFPAGEELACECIPLPAAQDSGETAQEPSVQILVDRSDSFSLCLYTLMGLGLCGSGRWVKRASLDFIPDWYHHGGPFQIGHGHAIRPDCLSFASVCCFVQPNTAPDNFSPRYDRAIIASFLRDRLFTPNAIAYRGPPHLAHGASVS